MLTTYSATSLSQGNCSTPFVLENTLLSSENTIPTNGASLQLEEQTREKAKAFTKALQRKFPQAGCELAFSSIMRAIVAYQRGAIERGTLRKASYWDRFLSEETWEEWLQDKTPLGQVLACFSDYMDNPHRSPSVSISELDKSIVAQAIIEADNLLGQEAETQYEATTSIEPQSVFSWAHDLFYSVDKHLFPLIPQAYAQNDDLSGFQIINQQITDLFSKLEVDMLNPTATSLALLDAIFEPYMKGIATFAKFHEVSVTQKKLHLRYLKSYNNELAKYETTIQNCPPPTCYAYNTFFREPSLRPIERQNSQQIVLAAAPGSIKWKVYRNIWFWPDPLKGEGYLNYDQANNRPEL